MGVGVYINIVLGSELFGVATYLTQSWGHYPTSVPKIETIASFHVATLRLKEAEQGTTLIQMVVLCISG